jgi:formylmethanofuran dehydrogenase subunit B
MIIRSQLRKKAINRVEKYQRENVKKKQYNVIFFMFDATSHWQYERTMKKSINLVQALKQEKRFHHFQFKNYNVVGRNSIRNQTPLWMGNVPENLKLGENKR